jgi:hypothetical protein
MLSVVLWPYICSAAPYIKTCTHGVIYTTVYTNNQIASLFKTPLPNCLLSSFFVIYIVENKLTVEKDTFPSRIDQMLVSTKFRRLSLSLDIWDNIYTACNIFHVDEHKH